MVFATLFYTTYGLSQAINCLSFNGTNDYVEADNISLNNIANTDFTFEAIVRGDESLQSQHPQIFSNRPNAGQGTMFFFHGVCGGSNHKLLCVQLNGVNHFIMNSGTFNASLLDGNCHHVAITRQGNVLTFYADGVAFGSKTITGLATTASSGDLWIGQDVPTNNTFEGNVSQVRNWDDARTGTYVFHVASKTDIKVVKIMRE